MKSSNFVINPRVIQYRSMALNDEATLMILDQSVGRQMSATFFEDLRHAQEITLAGFRRRPWTERVREAAAHLISPLL